MTDTQIAIGGTIKLIEIWGALALSGLGFIFFLAFIESCIKKAQMRGTQKGLIRTLINNLFL